jgi:hypothetical protein
VARDPFPLQWPDGWPRTPSHRRERSKFATYGAGGREVVGFTDARDGILRELRLHHTSQIVITSDLPLRRDGLPYADGRAADPGIAVYWVKQGVEQVIACDRWRSPAENMRAIELSIGALRGLDRWGSSSIVQRAFAGFAALPPGPEAPRRRTWREVLATDVEPGADPWPRLPAAELLAIAKARHRRLIRAAHPDAGGTHELAAELNTALAEAERELGGA